MHSVDCRPRRSLSQYGANAGTGHGDADRPCVPSQCRLEVNSEIRSHTTHDIGEEEVERIQCKQTSL